MVRYREQWKAQQEAAHVPPALRMNYDQMWKNLYIAPKRNMRKQRARLGKLREDRHLDPTSLPKNRALKQNVKNADSHADGREGKAHTSMAEDARYDMIQNDRAAGTLVTFTYANDTQGILAQAYADGICPASRMEELNNKCPGEHLIMNSESTTHFMNVESTLSYLHRGASVSMKRPREKYGFRHEKKSFGHSGCFVSGNVAHCQGNDRRREKWCEEANAIQADKPPGGWSATKKRGNPATRYTCISGSS